MDNEYQEFLYKNYKGEITNLLNTHSDSNHASISISLNVLKNENSKLYCEVINNIQEIEREWNIALLSIQNKIAKEDCFLDSDYTIKSNCHVRFTSLPLSEDILRGAFPDNECIGLFVQVKGNVIQMTQEKLLEIKREMVCSKCNSLFVFEAQYGKMYKFDIPERCLNIGNCKGILRLKNNLPKPEYCMDFQQIKIQEFISTDCGNYPTSLTICLENDLVNTCKPGECVTVCGTVEVRWRCFNARFRGLHVLSLRANSIVRENYKPNVCKDLDEQMFCAQAQWQENVDNLGLINARNLIVNSICPEIIGMSYIKLGLALALSSGFHIKRKKINEKRDQSHVLLVGDSGTGKSKLLNAMCQISVGAIHTNGLGCSVAGLTAAAFKDGSDWNLQAGALVLADGGLCCIDQFNLMHQHDKAAVHETMEQQTISIAKAGLVCKLQTQCVILATANFKSFAKHSTEKFSSSNLDIGGPLLSRFDLIFAVNDEREIEWDMQITDHLLGLTKHAYEPRNFESLSIQRLQSHFVAVREINPKFHNLAHILLGSYYKFYRSNFQRDLSRTTVRMLDSINRLAQSHARLMFRNEVLAFDAIVVIELLEGTWGFGKIIRQPNYTGKNEKLLIDDNVITTILNALNLANLKTNIIEEKQQFFNNANEIQSTVDQRNIQNQENEINTFGKEDKTVDCNFDEQKTINQNFNSKYRNNLPENFSSCIENSELQTNVSFSEKTKKSSKSNEIENRQVRNIIPIASHNTTKDSLLQPNVRLCKSPKISKKNETNNLSALCNDEYFDDGFEVVLSQSKFIDNNISDSRINIDIHKNEKFCNSKFTKVNEIEVHPEILQNGIESNIGSHSMFKSINLLNEEEVDSISLLECTNFGNGKGWDNFSCGNSSTKRSFDYSSEEKLNFDSKKIRTEKCNDKQYQNKIECIETNKTKITNEQKHIIGLMECLSKTDNLDFLELNF